MKHVKISTMLCLCCVAAAFLLLPSAAFAITAEFSAVSIESSAGQYCTNHWCDCTNAADSCQEGITIQLNGAGSEPDEGCTISEADYRWTARRITDNYAMTISAQRMPGGAAGWKFPDPGDWEVTLTVTQYGCVGHAGEQASKSKILYISNGKPAPMLWIKDSTGAWKNQNTAGSSIPIVLGQTSTVDCSTTVPGHDAIGSQDVAGGAISKCEWDFNYTTGAFNPNGNPSTTKPLLFTEQSELGLRQVALKVTDADRDYYNPSNPTDPYDPGDINLPADRSDILPNPETAVAVVLVNVINEGPVPVMDMAEPFESCNPDAEPGGFCEGIEYVFDGGLSTPGDNPFPTTECPDEEPAIERYYWDFDYDPEELEPTWEISGTTDEEVTWSWPDKGEYLIRMKIIDVCGRENTTQPKRVEVVNTYPSIELEKFVYHNAQAVDRHPLEGPGDVVRFSTANATTPEASPTSPGQHIQTRRYQFDYSPDLEFDYALFAPDPAYNNQSAPSYSFPQDGRYRVVACVYDDDWVNNPDSPYYLSRACTYVDVTVDDIPLSLTFGGPEGEEAVEEGTQTEFNIWNCDDTSRPMSQPCFETSCPDRHCFGDLCPYPSCNSETDLYNCMVYCTGSPTDAIVDVEWDLDMEMVSGTQRPQPSPTVECDTDPNSPDCCEWLEGTEDQQWVKFCPNGEDNVFWRNYDKVQVTFTSNRDYYVGVRVTDGDPDSPETRFSVKKVGVSDVPPIPRITGPTEVDEGSYEGMEHEWKSGTSTIAAGSILKREWDTDYQGDPEGFTPDPNFTNFTNIPLRFDDNHPETHKIALRLTDDDGTQAITSVIVDDFNPDITSEFITIRNVVPVFDEDSLSTTANEYVPGNTSPYQFVPEIIEPSIVDKMNLTCTLLDGPPTMTVDPNTCQVYWEPTNEDVTCLRHIPPDQPHSATIMVDDPDTALTPEQDGGIQEWKISVTNVNNKPYFDGLYPSSEPSCVVGQSSFVRVAVGDYDSACTETFFYRVESGPSWFYFPQITDSSAKCAPTEEDLAGSCSQSFPVTVCFEDDGDANGENHLGDCHSFNVVIHRPDVEPTVEADPAPVTGWNPGIIPLSGSYTVPGGGEATVIEWRQLIEESGNKKVYIENKTSLSTQFAAFDAGEYVFELKVCSDCDGNDICTVDTVTHTVIEYPTHAAASCKKNIDPLDTGATIGAYGSGDWNLAQAFPRSVEQTPLEEQVDYLWTDSNSVELMAEDQQSKMTPALSTTFVEAGVYEFSVQAREHIEGLEEGEEGAPWSEPVETSIEMMSIDLETPGNSDVLPVAIITLETDPPLSTGAIVLDATLSTARNGLTIDPRDYRWEYVSGPTENQVIEAAGPDGEEDWRQMSFTPARQKGLYTFSLVVEAGNKVSPPTTITIPVEAVASKLPVAHIQIEDASDTIQLAYPQGGSALNSAIPYARTRLLGTSSEYPFGSVANLDYHWRQIRGWPVMPEYDPDNEATDFVLGDTLELTFFSPGLYVFELTVADSTTRQGASVLEAPDRSEPATVTIRVHSSKNPSVPEIYRIEDGAMATGNIIFTNRTNEDVEMVVGAFDDTEDLENIQFSWCQTAGPPVVLSSYEGDRVSFVPDINHVQYKFDVWAFDGELQSAPLEITVIADTCNCPPVALIEQCDGQDAAECYLEGEEYQEIVLISASYDSTSCGEQEDCPTLPLIHSWNQDLEQSAEEVELTYGEDDGTVSFTPEKEGNYVFELIVSDGILQSESAFVSVSVNSNRPPVAVIDEDKISGRLNVGLSLDGSGSYDPDDDDITFQWTVGERTGDMAENDLDLKNADPNSSLDWSEATEVTFTPEYEGTVTFELVVTDEFNNQSQPDSVTVTVVKDCTDEDGDGYGDGADCLGPDCRPNDENCWSEGDDCCEETHVCEPDLDGDNYGSGEYCLDEDCNDEDATCHTGKCCKKGGGGCSNFGEPERNSGPWTVFALLAAFALAIFRRSRMRG